jgi:hypothetical protein
MLTIRLFDYLSLGVLTLDLGARNCFLMAFDYFLSRSRPPGTILFIEKNFFKHCLSFCATVVMEHCASSKLTFLGRLNDDLKLEFRIV